ncbi:hypothetical protein BS50DRAFT_161829 [Corynespora cassiicola Philippines]|uniref:Uncharacterized protein n=1 Tax=Corynespora cassiicola Philippines TaxID=1448308 RepID=A0A2T2N6X0_CORCC|nr:hypothetical protein BS50DRAFT_161829 [Corynespora cassiicola Philippines]
MAVAARPPQPEARRRARLAAWTDASRPLSPSACVLRRPAALLPCCPACALLLSLRPLPLRRLPPVCRSHYSLIVTSGASAIFLFLNWPPASVATDNGRPIKQAGSANLICRLNVALNRTAA